MVNLVSQRQAAVGLPVSTRISYEKLCSDRGRDNVIAVPHVGLKNAITVSLEEYSDIIALWLMMMMMMMVMMMMMMMMMMMRLISECDEGELSSSSR